jgi:hypothetical protein
MWGSSDVESPWITSRDLAGIPVEAQDVEYSYETWSTVGGEEAPGSSMRLVSHCLMVISKKPWQLWKKVIGLLLAAKGFRWRCPGRSAIVRTTMQFNILKKKIKQILWDCVESNPCSNFSNFNRPARKDSAGINDWIPWWKPTEDTIPHVLATRDLTQNQCIIVSDARQGWTTRAEERIKLILCILHRGIRLGWIRFDWIGPD